MGRGEVRLNPQTMHDNNAYHGKNACYQVHKSLWGVVLVCARLPQLIQTSTTDYECWITAQQRCKTPRASETTHRVTRTASIRPAGTEGSQRTQ